MKNWKTTLTGLVTLILTVIFSAKNIFSEDIAEQVSHFFVEGVAAITSIVLIFKAKDK